MARKKNNDLIATVKKFYKFYCNVTVVLSCIKARGLNKLNDKELCTDACKLLVGLEPDTDPIAEIEGINAYFNPYLHMLTLRAGSIATYNPATHVIVVDNTFMNFSNTTKNFVLYHELGHAKENENIDIGKLLIKGFVYNLTRPLYAVLGKVHPSELYADAYALKKSGVGVENAVDALKETMNAGNSIIGALEIKNRIKAIERKGGEK